MFDVKPRPNAQHLDPVPHCGCDVADDVAVVHDGTKEEAHRSSLLIGCSTPCLQLGTPPHGVQRNTLGAIVALNEGRDSCQHHWSSALCSIGLLWQGKGWDLQRSLPEQMAIVVDPFSITSLDMAHSNTRSSARERSRVRSLSARHGAHQIS